MNYTSPIISAKITIIGAGPAGSTLSLFLSKKKIPHILIDKEIFPRDKICGDGYTAEVLRVLREYSEELFQEFIGQSWVEPSYGFYLEMKDKSKVSFDFRNYLNKVGTVYVGKRIHFDHWLLSKTASPYCELLLGFQVKTITRENGLILLKCSRREEEKQFLCNLIIGADGERSIVRKTFHLEGIKKNRAHHFAGLRQYFKGVKKEFEHNPLEFYQPSLNYRGYFWIFYLPNGDCNVGIGGLSADVSAKKISLKNEFESFIKYHPVLSKRFANAKAISALEGWGIPLNSDANNYTGNNYLLLGDAAKFAEPFTGKGIGIALFTSMMAANTIEKVLKKNDFSENSLRILEQEINLKYRKEWKQLFYAQNQFVKPLLFGSFVRFISFKPINYFLGHHIAKKFIEFIEKPIKKKV